MLTRDGIALRAQRRSDLEVFVPAFRDNVEHHMLAAGGPWRPTPFVARQMEFDRRASEPPDPARALFTVVSGADHSEILGEAVLWGINLFNRNAHIGLSVLPGARGRGVGRAAVRLLCVYGFDVLGLHRLQIDTLTSNEPMLRTAKSCGFVLEGEHRQVGWSNGEFVDEAVLGLLVPEWRSREGV